MRTVSFVFAFVLLAHSAQAKDVALILNAQEQAALVQAIDATVRAHGIQAAQNMLHLWERLKTAPEVTGQKTDTPEPKKDATP